MIWLEIQLLIKLEKPWNKIPQNTSGAVKSEREVDRERYISPEETQQIIDELTLM